MIIVRSPLRVSFFGGGTDHPAWLNRGEPGAVLSTTIDKYVYVQMRRLPAVFDFNYRVAWGMLEEVQSINEIQHPVVREVLKHYAAEEETGWEVIYNADLPSKSGLGSSSAFTVSLLHAYFGNKERLSSKQALAKEAVFVEPALAGQIDRSFSGRQRLARLGVEVEVFGDFQERCRSCRGGRGFIAAAQLLDRVAQVQAGAQGSIAQSLRDCSAQIFESGGGRTGHGAFY